jgi:hypothetical protein
MSHPIPKDIIPKNATHPQPQLHPSPKDISLQGDFLFWGNAPSPRQEVYITR